MTLIFRKASQEDLDAVAGIYNKVHDAEEAGKTTTGWKREIYPVREVAEAALGRDDLYVCEVTEEGAETSAVAATGIINRIQVDVYADCDWIYKAPDDDVYVLHTLAVDPDFGRRGIGPAFVRFWEEEARKEHCSVLRIDTNARNRRARKMYASLGYIESGISPTEFNGIPGIDLVLMEKFIGTEIQQRLREMRDPAYAEFQSNLTPGLDSSRFIGVRTPQLRSYARELVREGGWQGFTEELPHKYFEEMQLHAFIISEIKDFDECLAMTERFLPYINNWATCDQLTPKAFARQPEKLLPEIDRWMASDHIYTVRFAVRMLMNHFLEDRFRMEYPERISQIRTEEYYLNMMIAWYFATALAKQYDAVLPFLEERKLDPWVHNKTIQKAIESYRITEEQKSYLRTLRIRKDRNTVK